MQLMLIPYPILPVTPDISEKPYKGQQAGCYTVASSESRLPQKTFTEQTRNP